ncbi:hypothetical protein ACI3KS_05220 [Microbacterium sp. ZW T5_45]|uniref:hypothetical protein n=1 Tax=Microbacterium sp. ZW T5_45 TaxID=3378080 RepID=UPI003854D349
MSIVIGWVLAIGVPALIVAGTIADARAQAAHDRFMAAVRDRNVAALAARGVTEGEKR